MKIIRFLDAAGHIHLGRPDSPDTATPLEGDLFGPLRPAGAPVAVAQVLAPLVPTAILGIGANYRQLFAGKPLPEYPIVFFKCGNTVQVPGGPIVLPRVAIRAEQVKFEGELAVVIGRGGKNIPASRAMEHVLGYTIANDVSASDWQRERVGQQWCKGKGFDTFCPLGPALVTRDEIPDPAALRVVTRVDGKVEQDESVGSMCFTVAELIAFLSAGHTLEPGNIILTGTPAGARFLAPGETVEITIEPIGTLRNPVVEETA